MLAMELVACQQVRRGSPWDWTGIPQCIKNLGSRNTGNHIHGKCGGFTRSKSIYDRSILHGVEKRDDGSALANGIDLAVGAMNTERTNLEEDIAVGEDGPSIDSLGASLLIGLVCELGFEASATLDQDAGKALFQ